MAFALPFTLLAFFPSMMNKLPKSGGWLNSVKVVLGFIEVALGLKFLSVADQTYHWGLLDREIYLAIWIVVFTLLGLYLLGKIKFAHDSEVKHIGIGRLALVIIVFSFVVYMIPGMWGAPLKGLSGYMPPITTQDFIVGQGGGSSNSATANTPAPFTARYSKASGAAHGLEMPHGLHAFFTLSEAEEYSRKVGKPIFVDITGHGCVNCRNMESYVWSDPKVLDMLRNDFVLVALYVDDKRIELEEQDWVTTENGKVLKKMGRANAHLALESYGQNAQPYYIIQDADRNILVTPKGYDLNIENFVKFLESGREAYRTRK
jgi:Thiol:disulfide interchange protein